MELARYEIVFLEIGTDSDHVHFLVQSVPMYSPKKIVQIIKSITAREIFKKCPLVKKQLWGGELWTDGYFCRKRLKDFFCSCAINLNGLVGLNRRWAKKSWL